MSLSRPPSSTLSLSLSSSSSSSSSSILDNQVKQTKLLTNDFTEEHLDEQLYGVEITGQLELKFFNEAIQEIALKHPFLRSRKMADGKIETNLALNLFPKNNWPLDNLIHNFEQKKSLETIVDILKKTEHSFFHPFDTENGPLWKCLLVRADNDRYIFFLKTTQYIFDNTSIGLFLRDLEFFYKNKFENKALINEPIIINHSDITLTEAKKNYWQQYLKESTSSEIPTDLTPVEQTYQLTQLETTLPEPLLKTIGIQKDCEEEFLLAALFLLIYRHILQNDICIGFVAENRNENKASIQNLQTIIPLRILIDANSTFSQLVETVKILIKKNKSMQLPEIEMRKYFNSASEVLFPILVSFKKKNSLHLQNCQTSCVREIRTQSHQECHFFLENTAQGWRTTLEFREDLFRKELFNRMFQHWNVLLTNIGKNPLEKISDLSLLTPREIKQLVRVNDTDKKLIFKGFVHDLLITYSQTIPEKKAIVFHQEDGGTQSINYKNLYQKALQIATYLQANAIGPEQTVGVCVSQRTIESTIIKYGIYLSGGVFVPLEPKFENLTTKINETKLRILFVDDEIIKFFPKYMRGLLLINVANLDQIFKLNKKHQNKFRVPDLKPTNLIYIRYTSGTSQALSTELKNSSPNIQEKLPTPVNKAVMITHQGITERINAILDRKLPSHAKVLGTAPIYWDPSEFEDIEALAIKGELHIIFEKGRISPSVLKQVINKEEINIITLTPKVLANLNPNELKSLKDVICMGEIPNPSLLDAWLPKGVRNEYGPTELTIFCTEHQCKAGEPYRSIGRNTRGIKMFITDGKHELPIGVTGKLLIASKKSLARGYINPDLTNKKFKNYLFDSKKRRFSEITHTKNQLSGSKKKFKKHKIIKVYDTEDLARRLPPDGEQIEFMGRNSSLIKLSGVWVSLPDIERELCRHPQIQDAVVRTTQNSQSLIGYLVTKPDAKIESLEKFIQTINQYLAHISHLSVVSRLAFIHILKEIPKTANGKTNFQALPTLKDFKSIVKDPSTQLQATIRTIWSEILDIPEKSIGVDVPLKAGLGCNSLSFATFESRICNQFTFKNQSIFFGMEDKNIEQLASYIENNWDEKQEAASFTFVSKTPRGVNAFVPETDNSSTVSTFTFFAASSSSSHSQSNQSQPTNSPPERTKLIPSG